MYGDKIEDIWFLTYDSFCFVFSLVGQIDITRIFVAGAMELLLTKIWYCKNAFSFQNATTTMASYETTTVYYYVQARSDFCSW